MQGRSAFRERKNGRRYEPVGVLQSGYVSRWLLVPRLGALIRIDQATCVMRRMGLACSFETSGNDDSVSQTQMSAGGHQRRFGTVSDGVRSSSDSGRLRQRSQPTLRASKRHVHCSKRCSDFDAGGVNHTRADQPAAPDLMEFASVAVGNARLGSPMLWRARQS